MRYLTEVADAIWYLKKVDWLSALTAEEADRLGSRAVTRVFKKGEMVYFPQEPGETVLLLATGRIKLKTITPEGKEVILAFIEEGEMFGELAIVDNAARGEFAEAVQESRVIAIPTVDLRVVVRSRPDAALGVTRLVGLRRRRIQNRLQNILFRPNRERLIHLLLELVETHGVRDGAHWQIGIRLTHQELASLIGATRESVTLILGKLQAEKLIRVRRRQIVVLDRSRLLSEANGSLRPVEQQPSPRPSSPRPRQRDIGHAERR